jgi:hypothetical protein
MPSQVNAQLSPRPIAKVSVNAPAPTPAVGASTGTKVAVAAGGITLTAILVSAIAGWSISKLADKAWDAIRGK